MQQLDLRQGECKQQQQDSRDNMVGIFTSKVHAYGKHRPSTLAACERQASMTCPAVVLWSMGSGHGPPVECNSKMWDVVLEAGLCKDVGCRV